jgi:hypothetical protein
MPNGVDSSRPESSLEAPPEKALRPAVRVAGATLGAAALVDAAGAVSGAASWGPLSVPQEVVGLAGQARGSLAFGARHHTASLPGLIIDRRRDFLLPAAVAGSAQMKAEFQRRRNVTEEGFRSLTIQKTYISPTNGAKHALSLTSTGVRAIAEAASPLRRSAFLLSGRRPPRLQVEQVSRGAVCRSVCGMGVTRLRKEVN